MGVGVGWPLLEEDVEVQPAIATIKMANSETISGRNLDDITNSPYLSDKPALAGVRRAAESLRMRLWEAIFVSYPPRAKPAQSHIFYHSPTEPLLQGRKGRICVWVINRSAQREHKGTFEAQG